MRIDFEALAYVPDGQEWDTATVHNVFALIADYSIRVVHFYPEVRVLRHDRSNKWGVQGFSVSGGSDLDSYDHNFDDSNPLFSIKGIMLNGKICGPGLGFVSTVEEAMEFLRDPETAGWAMELENEADK